MYVAEKHFNVSMSYRNTEERDSTFIFQYGKVCIAQTRLMIYLLAENTTIEQLQTDKQGQLCKEPQNGSTRCVTRWIIDKESALHLEDTSSLQHSL